MKLKEVANERADKKRGFGNAAAEYKAGRVLDRPA
jgi:hypothetical protein